jgi:hypothetical protein
MKFFWYMHTRCYDDEVLPSKKREKKKKAQECRKLLATKPKTRSNPINQNSCLDRRREKGKAKKGPTPKTPVVSIRPSQRKTKKVVVHKFSFSNPLPHPNPINKSFHRRNHLLTLPDIPAQATNSNALDLPRLVLDHHALPIKLLGLCLLATRGKLSNDIGIGIQSPQTAVANPLSDNIVDEPQLRVNVVCPHDASPHAVAFVQEHLDRVRQDLAAGDVVREQVHVRAQVLRGFGGDARGADEVAGSGQHELGVVREVALHGAVCKDPQAHVPDALVEADERVVVLPLAATHADVAFQALAHVAAELGPQDAEGLPTSRFGGQGTFLDAAEAFVDLVDDAIFGAVFEDFQRYDLAVLEILAQLGEPAAAVVVVDVGDGSVVFCRGVEDAADGAVFEDVADAVLDAVVDPFADEGKVFGVSGVWAAGLAGERGRVADGVGEVVAESGEALEDCGRVCVWVRVWGADDPARARKHLAHSRWRGERKCLRSWPFFQILVG